MTTYADMVTNLMALFVLLYAFSELDAQRFQSIISSFRAHAGVLTGGQMIGDLQTQAPLPKSEEREELRRLLEDFVRREGLEDAVEIVVSTEAVALSFRDQVFFDSGRADLREDSKHILRKLGELLAPRRNALRIEGHTDNVPISNAQFPSNWELSVYRASTVVRFLEDSCSIRSRRLSAAGYGEYRPVVPNTTPVNLARNRRVDIILFLQEEEAALGH